MEVLGLLLVLLISVPTSVLSQMLVAKVSVNGIRGTVTFQNATTGVAGGNTSVTFNLVTLGSTSFPVPMFWEFRTFRVNYNVADRCSQAQLGSKILPSVGGTTTNGTISGVDLTGISSIEGRSIVFLNASNQTVACGTVERDGDYVTTFATFRETILGTVTFRQISGEPTSLTRVSTDLYSDGSFNQGKTLQWRIVTGDCTGNQTFNPSSGSVSASCSNISHSSCMVGDLFRKLGAVPVGVVKGGMPMTAVDQNLPLQGGNNIAGQFLQLIGSDNKVEACAIISTYDLHAGMATFDNDGVTGTITLTQLSPFDATTLKVNLTGLQNKAGGYHVHVYPVAERVVMNQALCSDLAVAAHFNPFNIIYTNSSPLAAMSTEDAFEVGDLSRKFGMLNNLTSYSNTFMDWNLPLFGANSVLGRSMVIHTSATGGPRWVCTNIIDTAAVTTALATFYYPVIGHVLLQQRQGMERTETSVYVELNYADGSTQETMNHSWMVSVNAAGDDFLLPNLDTRCNSAGDVFNPFDVSMSNHTMQCNTNTPLGCKAGDLNGKHGSLGVRKNGTWAKAYFTDTNLPLTGVNSVVNKAIVLMTASGGANRLSCATIKLVWPRTAKADLGSNGVVTFIQTTGIVQRPTAISSMLSAGSSRYSINNWWAASCTSLGGVYNPFNASDSGQTKDQIPVGDLAKKFPSGLANSSQDPNLNLFGVRSVVGHAFSVMVGGANSSSCGNIMDASVEGGIQLGAKATFTGDISGDISLMQYLYPDGTMSDTTVIVNLMNANAANATMNHNWHVHQHYVGEDATATSMRCMSTGDHYNPFMVNLNNTELYKAECSVQNPLRCELGDQANKLGTYSMGSGPIAFNDPCLPLVGPYSVIGRSFVVHAANRGAARIACTDIVSTDTTNVTDVNIATSSTTINKTEVAAVISRAIESQIYDVSVVVTNMKGQCGGATIRVYFLGLWASQNTAKFQNVLKSNPSVLGTYKPMTCGAASSLISILLLVACFLLGRYFQ